MNQRPWLPIQIAIVVLAAALLQAFPALAGERSLYWQALKVEAMLDGDGRLQVLERQHMVFSGYWNGGERSFHLRPGQTVELEGITRLDPQTGERRPLVHGSLDLLDRFNWHDRKTLRWRARLPDDPPFAQTQIVYELRYTLSQILIPAGNGIYLLDHDFAFPERQWPILAFSLDLDLDPLWQSPSAFSGKLTRGRLEPGDSVVLSLALTTRDGSVPAAAGRRQPTATTRQSAASPALVRYALFAGAAATLLCSLAAFVRHEKRAGRFAPLPAACLIDQAWLAEHIFSLAPELVGAAWDKTTGAGEVAAVIARLELEDKLTSQLKNTRFLFLFKKTVLCLRLLVDRATLSGYEQDLVNALFVQGDETDTEIIAKHYQFRGIDPTTKVKSGIEKKVRTLCRPSQGPLQWTWLRPALLALLAIHVLVIGAIIYRGEFVPLAAMIASSMALLLMAFVLAHLQGIAVDHLPGWIGLCTLPLLALLGLLAWLLLGDGLQASLWLTTGMTLWSCAIFDGIFLFARTVESREEIALRKTLAAGRKYLARELKKAAPNLQDAWLPYLLAFGLAPQVERWFRSFGGGTGAAGSGLSGGSGGEAVSGWSGGGATFGGGSFGGGGASGSWAEAVSSMASGLAASGGAGSGGSSGGGGGGGW